jgi:hypothetical protein
MLIGSEYHKEDFHQWGASSLRRSLLVVSRTYQTFTLKKWGDLSRDD